jgi:hypothetical protein
MTIYLCGGDRTIELPSGRIHTEMANVSVSIYCMPICFKYLLHFYNVVGSILLMSLPCPIPLEWRYGFICCPSSNPKVNSLNPSCVHPHRQLRTNPQDKQQIEMYSTVDRYVLQLSTASSLPDSLILYAYFLRCR